MLKGQKSQISYIWTSSWQHTFKSQTTNGSEWECKSETQVKWFLNKLSTPPSIFFLSLCLVRTLDSTWDTFTVTIFVRTMAMQCDEARPVFVLLSLITLRRDKEMGAINKKTGGHALLITLTLSLQVHTMGCRGKLSGCTSYSQTTRSPGKQ